MPGELRRSHENPGESRGAQEMPGELFGGLTPWGGASARGAPPHTSLLPPSSQVQVQEEARVQVQEEAQVQVQEEAQVQVQEVWRSMWYCGLWQ